MNAGGSVTHWIEEIKGGNHDAAQDLWERYFTRLAHLARKRLISRQRRVVDEEDIVLAVFQAFCSAAEKGRFPELADRTGLWRVLVKMTARKVMDQNRVHLRKKRGGGNVRGESALQPLGPENDAQAFAQIIGNSPTPEFVNMISEEVERLLESLDDSGLRHLVVAKMEGYTNREIAQQLGCSERTVERRLKLIRAQCQEELGNE